MKGYDFPSSSCILSEWKNRVTKDLNPTRLIFFKLDFFILFSECFVSERVQAVVHSGTALNPLSTFSGPAVGRAGTRHSLAVQKPGWAVPVSGP